jgi:peptide/nickel transport system substrate-binding protein
MNFYRYWVNGVVFCLLTFVFAQGNDNIFVQLIDEIPETLDPTQQGDGNIVLTYIAENVYEPLLSFDTSGNLVPILATEWKVSDDSLRYTFTLREGVTFHSGNSLRCEDAAYSLHRLLVTGQGYASVFLASVLGFESWDEGLATETPFSALIDAVSCNDNGELVITLIQPDLYFLNKLSLLLIVDQRFLADNGEWSGTETDWQAWIGRTLETLVLNQTSAGTNAFRLLNNEPSRIVYEAFENYWGQKPSLKNVILQPVTDYNTQALALKTGDADALFWMPVAFRGQVEGAEGVIVQHAPGRVVELLAFNQNIDPASPFLGSSKLDGAGIPPNFFSDVHVRRGFIAAYNATAVIQTTLGGHGRTLNMALPSLLGGTDATLTALQFDLELAEKELREAWGGQVWKVGFSLDFPYLPGIDEPHDVPLFAEVKAGLEKLNPKFRVNLVPHEIGETTQPGFEPLSLGYWWSDYGAPVDYLEAIYQGRGDQFESVFPEDEMLAELVTQAVTEGDEAQRQALYQQISQRATELSNFILLPEQDTVLFYRDTLKGYGETYNPFRYGFVQWNQLSK